MAACVQCLQAIETQARFCPNCGCQQATSCGNSLIPGGEASRWVRMALGAGAISAGVGSVFAVFYLVYTLVMGQWFNACVFAPLALLNQLGMLVLFLRVGNFLWFNPRYIAGGLWLRFRLRTLLIGLTLMSVGLAWYAAHARQRGVEQRAIAEIQRLAPGSRLFVCDGDHFFDCAFEMNNRIHAQSPAPRWLQQFLDRIGFDVLYRVDSISLDDSAIDDSVLVPLAEFTSARQISFSGTSVTQSGVEELRAALPGAKIEFTPKSAENGSRNGGGFF